jgi:hypothetical protein
MEAQAAADQAHAKFDDDRSEFSGYLNLWKWLENSRGGKPHLPASMKQQIAIKQPQSKQGAVKVGTTGVPTEHKLSNRQYEQLLRQNFINIRRVREWRDTHTQLLTVVTEHKWRINTQPASYEQLHLSMLAGLLGNVGYKLEDEEAYLFAEAQAKLAKILVDRTFLAVNDAAIERFVETASISDGDKNIPAATSISVTPSKIATSNKVYVFDETSTANNGNNGLG